MMAVRDFLLISILAGIFITGLFGIFANPQIWNDYQVYNKHVGEKTYSGIFNLINESASETEAMTTNMSTDLQHETTAGYLTTGSTTISIIKSALSFKFLGALQNTSSQIAMEFHVPPFLINSAIAMIVCIAIFTIISAFMRWRT